MPKKFKNIWLLIASYYFYACWNVKYVILLASCTAVTYVSGILLDKAGKEKRTKKVILGITVLLNLGVLFYYKYLDFALYFVRHAARLINIEIETPSFDIILPVGISFFIFQGIGYLVDVYRGQKKSEKQIISFALFISFFPQLLSGPIGRAKDLLPQYQNTKPFDVSNLKKGFAMMLWGYFLKLVIADRCSILVDTVYSSYLDYTGAPLVFASLVFAIQIYCDFMGYSTLAKGAAKILGIDLVENFRQPYFATSIKAFWGRWHISLSTWLRDYVYIPLGGNRCSKIKKYRNIMLTFLASGLWHGASPSFVIWGALHGIYQIIGDIFKPTGKRITNRLAIRTESTWWKVLCALKTFILVDFSWIFFKANSLPKALYIIKNMFCFGNMGTFLKDGIFQLGLDQFNMFLLLLGTFALIAVSVLKEKGRDIYRWILKQRFPIKYCFYLILICILILSMDVGGKEFIYFQF